ncbi:MAG: enoyl-CoA hydratase/isomerase family protein [Acidimicrobiia bacterium]
MTGTTIRLERQGAVALITLDRPDVLNSFNTAMADELLLVAGELESDATIGAVVVTGSGGKAFCAGADIAEFGALSSPDDFHEFISHLSRAVEAIGALRQPVIAAVEGVAFGGGCELAMACDLRTASERTRFGLPEIKLGLLPGLGGTQRAIRLLPVAVATRMLLIGDPIAAAEAHLVGFCEPPTPVGGALDAAMVLAEQLSEGPREAMAAAKHLIRDGRELPLRDAIALEQATGRRLFGTPDAAEGVSAFLKKRTAAFGAG